jgi:hypothetical protein
MLHHKLYFLLFICYMLFTISCNKIALMKPFSISGRIIDGATKQPIPNYNVKLNFKNETNGNWLDFRSVDNISSCKTNENGEYTLLTSSHQPDDSGDLYEVKSNGQSNLTGVSETISALELESKKSIRVRNIQVYEWLNLNVNVNFTGVMDSNNLILVDINNTIMNMGCSFRSYEIITNYNFQIANNTKTIVTWRGIKNGTHLGPFVDTVYFTKSNSSYNITF